MSARLPSTLLREIFRGTAIIITLPEEESSVEFCAYHPYAPVGTSSEGRFFVEAPASGHAPVLHFSLSGREDVMFATPVTGSRNSRPQGLEFRHVLTQLRFQVIDSYASLNEVSLRGISLLGGQ